MLAVNNNCKMSTDFSANQNRGLVTPPTKSNAICPLSRVADEGQIIRKISCKIQAHGLKSVGIKKFNQKVNYAYSINAML